MKNPPSALKPKKLYRWITWHRDPEVAVASLATQQLRILNSYLGRAGAQSGIPSFVGGLILHEMAGRLMIQKDAKDQ